MNYDKEPELPDRPAKPASRRVWRWLAGGLLLAVAVWGLLGRGPALTPEQRAVARQIAGLEGEVQALRADLAALPADAEPAVRRRLLEQAVAKQREVMRRREPPAPADAVAMDELQARFDEARAQELEAMSRALESAASDLRRQGSRATAVEKLKEALQLQREVNRTVSARATKDFTREAQLQRMIEELVAEPLLAQARKALADARTATDGGRWADAVESYARARETQRRLNAEFPRSRYADTGVEAQIDTELSALRVTQAQAELGLYLRQAADAAGAGRWEEGDRLYGLAAERQQLLNTQFPQSPFASAEQLERIESERQSLRLELRMEELRRADAAIAAHLRRREIFQAQRAIPAAFEKMQEASRQLPKARGFDEELGARLSYLLRREPELVLIQDKVYDLLRPLPGMTKAAMLGSELPQDLFTALMNDNPSRQPGPERPVDSVTHTEALEFCRRLGWILGAVVRLPGPQECKRVAGDPAFKDLAGGAEEWLAALSTDENGAPVLGSDGAMRSAPRAERSPERSFRVVVEIDLLAGVDVLKK